MPGLFPTGREMVIPSSYSLSLGFQELGNARVSQRVREGDRDVSSPIIRRRFMAGLSNFEILYKPIVGEWALYDNSGSEPVLVEEGVKL